MTPQDLKKLVEELMKQMGLTVKAEVTADGDVFLLNLTGGDARLFEASRENRGSALLTILKLMIKQQGHSEPKIVLDINNQRHERLQNIAQMAKKTAEMVRVRGGEEELRPMTPAERRAVHMELKKMDGIRTESRGEEPHRRIVIIQDSAE